ncbi:MAG: GDSL-type esterase/lipase family protein [Angustibacter sp.]
MPVSSFFLPPRHRGHTAARRTLLLLGLLGLSVILSGPARPVSATTASYVALGDSFASGFGLGSYEPGTHHGEGGNDCQRSALAYGPAVARELGLALGFHACQGAVTADLSRPRPGTWQEGAQLEALSESTRLVTLGIGGNDAQFSQVLRDCIDGVELLPFNTCYQDPKVTAPVSSALARLAGRATEPAATMTFADLFAQAQRRAPQATRVAVGYPRLFPPQGGTRVPWLGARCEGVKEVDQRWMVQRIDELNDIMRYEAQRHGFIFADPNPELAGHELCGLAEDWFYPLLSPGRFHPNVAGHLALAQTVVRAAASGPAKTLTPAPEVNRRPTGKITVHRKGGTVEFRANSLMDVDGSISRLEWYSTTATATRHSTGNSLKRALENTPAQTITLIITDDRGGETFRDLLWLPSLSPSDSREQAVGPGIVGTREVAVQNILRETLRLDGRVVPPEQIRVADLNADGRPDLGLNRSWARSGCLSGLLQNRRPFTSCSVD